MQLPPSPAQSHCPRRGFVESWRPSFTTMFWTEEIAAKVSGPQIINDSKTPSGRVHVGALRGVLIHDAIFRTLRGKGIEARYLFGVDDYDPLDEIPAGKGAHFEQYLGQPLC